MGSYETDKNLNINTLNHHLNLIEGIDKTASHLPIKNLPATILVDNYFITINTNGVITMDEEKLEEELNFENFKNYKEIYFSSIDNNCDFKTTYTLEETYPIILIAVSSIGNNSFENAYTSISLTNTTQNLLKLIENERHPYASYQYNSSLTLGYLTQPEIGTIIEASAVYRGALHIYALGISNENNE